MRTSEQIDQIATALAAAQTDFPNIEKNRKNPHFKSYYADLFSILKSCRPVLNKHGIAFIQGVSNHNQEVVVTSRLVHKSGQWVEDDFAIKPEKDTPQGRGSAATYAKRYGAEGILGISATDEDDGEVAEQREVKEEQIYNGCDNHKKVLAHLFAKHGVEESKLKSQINMKSIGKPFSKLEAIVVESVR